MRKDELFKKLAGVWDAKKIKKIKSQYALANNPYQKGDLFTDHLGTIRVKQIKVYYPDDALPSCFYIGDCITEKGTLNKQIPTRTAYQEDDIKQ